MFTSFPWWCQSISWETERSINPTGHWTKGKTEQDDLRWPKGIPFWFIIKIDILTVIIPSHLKVIRNLFLSVYVTHMAIHMFIGQTCKYLLLKYMQILITCLLLSCSIFIFCKLSADDDCPELSRARREKKREEVMGKNRRIWGEERDADYGIMVQHSQ